VILPTKHLSERRCLLAIGADILPHLERPQTVSYLWSRLSARTTLRDREFITYDWFVLALSFLAAVGTVEFASNRVRRLH
jgi:hypothetical protein